MTDAYFWYVFTAYAAAVILIGGLAAAIFLNARRTRAELEKEETRR